MEPLELLPLTFQNVFPVIYYSVTTFPYPCPNPSGFKWQFIIVAHVFVHQMSSTVQFQLGSSHVLPSDVTRVRGIRRLNRAGHPRWFFTHKSDLLHEGCFSGVGIAETKAETARLVLTQPQKTCSILTYQFQENLIPNPYSRGGNLTGHEYWKMWDIFKDQLLSKKIHFYDQENFPFVF